MLRWSVNPRAARRKPYFFLSGTGSPEPNTTPVRQSFLLCPTAHGHPFVGTCRNRNHWRPGIPSHLSLSLTNGSPLMIPEARKEGLLSSLPFQAKVVFAQTPWKSWICRGQKDDFVLPLSRTSLLGCHGTGLSSIGHEVGFRKIAGKTRGQAQRPGGRKGFLGWAPGAGRNVGLRSREGVGLQEQGGVLSLGPTVRSIVSGTHRLAKGRGTSLRWTQAAAVPNSAPGVAMRKRDTMAPHERNDRGKRRCIFRFVGRRRVGGEQDTKVGTRGFLPRTCPV